MNTEGTPLHKINILDDSIDQSTVQVALMKVKADEKNSGFIYEQFKEKEGYFKEKYRQQRLWERENNCCFWGFDIFLKQSDYTKIRCRCGVIDGKCIQARKWLKSLFREEEFSKLRIIFERFRKMQKADISNFSKLIEEEMVKVEAVWSAQILNCRTRAMEVITLFIKYCIYYRKKPYSKLYVWLATAIVYHCNSEDAFWILEAITSKLQLSNPSKPFEIRVQTLTYLINKNFGEAVKELQRKQIMLKPLISEFLGLLMCNYTQLENYGFNLGMILKKGWDYLTLLIMSYFDKKFQKIMNKRLENSHDILKELLKKQTEWGLIFYHIDIFTQKDITTLNPKNLNEEFNDDNQ